MSLSSRSQATPASNGVVQLVPDPAKGVKTFMDADVIAAAYDDVGRLCRWDDLFPITLLPRSRFERVLGHQTSQRSPVDGTVKKVGKDAVVVTDHKGTDHEVQTYNYYPLNDAKSVLHSTPMVCGRIVASAPSSPLTLGTSATTSPRSWLACNAPPSPTHRRLRR